ncbi:MAG: hypothetical protein K0S75_386 [Clostridia bacterium]|nr:hypothetical protein [Clostridia bacterium]
MKILQGLISLRQTRGGRKLQENAKNRHEIILFIRNFIILALFALLTTAYVNRTGAYPWGSDSFGHLFKANILYDSMKQGNIFLNYHESWYNGIQPFRYWAPLPYYVLALINMFTADIFKTYNVFIIFTFILGGLGWLCWGYYLKRQNLALVFAILWFLVPDNLRVFFSEGNIPFVMINSLLPFVLLFSYKTVRGEGIISYLSLAAFMSIVTLTHAMLAAMIGIGLFIFAIMDSTISKKYNNNFIMLLYAFMGIMLSSFWLFPALRGGILSLDANAVTTVMESLTYPLSISLNPLLRLSDIELYYFGLTFAAVVIFGFLFSTKKERPLFAVGLTIMLGTTKAALPLLMKLPLNQLFWMRRFTAIAIAMIIIGVLLWKNLRKSILISLVVLLIVDSAVSFYVLGYNAKFPQRLSESLDTATRISTQRIAVLDSSYFGSFPSYYIPYNKSNGAKSQVFGWSWQGAATAQNIVMLNTALEMEYHDFMFDRALELGADTLVIKKNFITDFAQLDNTAVKAGYQKQGEDELTITYKYPVVESFGTKVTYEGIAIGAYATNAIYIFPKLTVGQDSYIDHYSFDELKDYKVIFLSGFKYNNKEKAESLLIKLSSYGVKVVIDAVGLNESFLGVSEEPIVIKQGFQEVYYKDKKIVLQNFPEEYSVWKTGFLHGIDNEENYQIINRRIIKYLGNKYNENLTFIGMNIPYFAFLTKDEAAVKILADTLAMKAFEAPKRVIQPVKIELSGNILSIKTNAPNTIVPVAALDAFIVREGSYSVQNNLINTKSKELEIKIVYPYLGTGIIISLISLLLIIGMTVAINIIDNRSKTEGDVDQTGSDYE